MTRHRPHPALRRAVDRVLVFVTKVVSRAWFRSVETQNLDRITNDRPILIAANHANGFVDPVIIMATSPRTPQFLAKSGLWKLAPVGFLLDAAGVLPVRRRSDGTSGDNERMFEACDAVLRADGVIGIFPEGTVNDTLTLKPLKTGAARIALGARQAGAMGLRIVPVGLIYIDKAKPRSRVLVRAAAPIDLDEVLPALAAGGDSSPANRALVDALTALIGERLRDASVDFADEDRARLFVEAASIYARAPDADPSHRLSLAAVEPLARRLDRADEAKQVAVLEALDTYLSRLKLLSLDDVDVIPGNTPERLDQRLRLSTAKVATLTPFAAVGTVMNVVPYQAMRLVWRRPMKRISRANNTVLAGMVVFPLTWLAWALVGRRRGLKHPWRNAFVVGPLCGQAAVAWWEQLHSFRHGRLAWKRLLRHEDLLTDLRAERAHVVASVADALGDTPPAVLPR